MKQVKMIVFYPTYRFIPYRQNLHKKVMKQVRMRMSHTIYISITDLVEKIKVKNEIKLLIFPYLSFIPRYARQI